MNSKHRPYQFYRRIIQNRDRWDHCLFLILVVLLCDRVARNPAYPFLEKPVFCRYSTMVWLRGQASASIRRSAARRTENADGTAINQFRLKAIPTNLHDARRPADPQSVIQTPDHLEEKALELTEWISSKRNIFCLTGAGLSTDSGIPDYRGHRGSYHVGHKPIIHKQFMESPYQRRRYWGRSMVGWQKFHAAKPNKGHYSLANLERMGNLGVNMEDRVDFYDELDRDEFLFTSGQRRLTILTQNVDSLHDRAGSKDVLALHGGNTSVRCMNCGYRLNRNDYQQQLEESNRSWLEEHRTRLKEENSETSNRHQQQTHMRPDGDVQLQQANYDKVHLPSCPCCRDGFFKPDVVFFGDSVPKHRVRICQEAVDNCDGILVVGSSLTVHSAFRHVRAASERGISVAILNVGDTRAEAEGLKGLRKIEAPISDTLERCVKLLGNT